MREAAPSCSLIERSDGIGRQRTEAHGRNIEDRGSIGLRDAGFQCAVLGLANLDAIVSGGDAGWCDRMIHPFEAGGVHVFSRAERTLVELTLGALIDN